MNAKTTTMLALALCGGLTLSAFAGQAATSATAGTAGYGSGTAAATADYIGRGEGFTRTRADSGRINVARGLAVGVDEQGLSVSASYALAGQRGPAVGGTFNVHVGRDGQATVSGGRVISQGDPARAVRVGGSAGKARYRSPQAVSAARGWSGPRGEVEAKTRSRSAFSYPRGHVRTNQRPRAYRSRW